MGEEGKEAGGEEVSVGKARLLRLEIAMGEDMAVGYTELGKVVGHMGVVAVMGDGREAVK